jgi:hypothetical protein
LVVVPPWRFLARTSFDGFEGASAMKHCGDLSRCRQLNLVSQLASPRDNTQIETGVNR